MATLTAGELTNLRTTAHRATPYLSVFQPATLLAGLVNDGAASRGMRSIAYDNGTGTGFATIIAGQTLEVDTSTGTRRVRIKSITGDQTSGTITVAENSIVWANNQVIRVLHHYDLWGIPPRISGGIFYKDYDIVYSNQNSQPNPVAIAGPMKAGFLSAGTIAFAIDGSPSYAVASGATISSYAWSCVHNGGGTTGITITNAAIATTTLTITVADSYWLTLTVTDSNGKTQTTHRLVFVHDSGSMPYVDFTISQVSGDWQSGGYQFGLSGVDGLTLADLPDRTPVLLWYENKFNDTAAYVNVWPTGDNILCGGYFRNDSDSDNLEKGTGQADFTVTSADGVIDNIVELGSISINAMTSPSKWYEYASWLTVGRGIHHLLKWHSTVLECVDVYGLTDNTTGVKVCDFTEPTLLQQANSLSYSRGIFAKVVSDRLGRLHLTEDSQMLNTTARAALDTVFTLTVSDLSGVVNLARQTEERVATAELNGFAFDGATGTPFIACVPGYIESSISYLTPEPRGAASANVNGQVLIDQTDANERVGRVLASENNDPQEIRFTAPANYSGAFEIVPSVGFYEWGIANSVLSRQIDLFGLNLICRNVSHAVNVTSGTIQTSVVFEPEATGPSGIPGNYPVGYPVPPFRIPPTEDTGGGGGGGDQADIVVVYQGSGAAKVLQYSSGSLALGSEFVYATGSIIFNAVAGLSTTAAIVAYLESDTFEAKAKVLSILGTTITAGSEADIDTSVEGVTNVVALSATKAVAFHQTAVGNYATVLDISGTTITPGSPTLINAGGSNTKACRLSGSKIFAAYADGSLYGVVLDISGTTITVNSPDAISTGSFYISTVGMSATTAIVFAQYSNEVYAFPITAITTTFTAGAGVQVSATAEASDWSIGGNTGAYVSANQAVIQYSGSSPAGQVRVTLVNFDGTNIAVDTTTSFSLISSASGQAGHNMMATSDNVVISAYWNETNDAGQIASSTVSGSVVTSENNNISNGVNPVESFAVLKAIT